MQDHATATAIAVIAALLGTALCAAVSGTESTPVAASRFWYGLIAIISMALWNLVQLPDPCRSHRPGVDRGRTQGGQTGLGAADGDPLSQRPKDAINSMSSWLVRGLTT